MAAALLPALAPLRSQELTAPDRSEAAGDVPAAIAAWRAAQSDAETRVTGLRVQYDTALEPAVLRACLAGRGWRDRVLLLRALYQRRELSGAELVQALESPSWAVRREALRIAARFDPRPELSAELRVRFDRAVRATLGDASGRVQAVAFATADQLGLLPDEQWMELVRLEEGIGPALRHACAVGSRHAARVEFLLDPRTASLREEQRLEALRLLEGVDLSARARASARELASSETWQPESETPRSELRRRACLLIETRSWPEDVAELVFDGLKSASESAERMLRLLPQSRASALVRLAFPSDEVEATRRSFAALARAELEAAQFALTRVATLAPELWHSALQALERRIPKECVTRFVADFDTLEANFRREVLAVFGKQLAMHPEGRAHVSGMLAPARAELEPEAAKIAFYASVAARIVGPEVLAFAARYPEMQQRLIGLDSVPARFWLDTLRREEAVEVRWVAIKGLAQYAPDPEVATRLRAYVRADFSPRLRAAALSSYLSADAPHALAEAIEEIDAMRVSKLDETFLGFLREGRAAWIDDAWQLLEKTRFHSRVPRIRAMRGELEIAREFLPRALKLRGVELRRMRKSLARSIRPADLDLVFAQLRAPESGEDDIWRRSEVLEWFKLRPELDVLQRLRSALRLERDPDMRAMLEAAMLRCGEASLLRANIEAWCSKDPEASEGSLLEVHGALPRAEALAEAGLDFVVDLAFAPVLRDVVELTGIEHEIPQFGVRLEAHYPLLRPALRTLVRARPQLARARLAARIASPAYAVVRTKCPASYLLRICVHAAREGRGWSVVEPILKLVAARLDGSPAGEAVADLLHARLLWERHDGDALRRSEQLARSGLEGLLARSLDERLLERIARDICPQSSAPPRATLRAFATALRAKNAPTERARERLRRAVRLAAREDPRLRARLLR